MQPEVLVEVLLNWMGAAGALVYVIFIIKQSEPGPLRNKLALVMIIGAIFMISRGVYWLTGDSIAKILEMFFISFLPICLLICSEQIMRRHAPGFIKLTAFSASLLLGYFAIFTTFDKFANTLLLTYEIFILTFISFFILCRDKNDLSDQEESIVESCGQTALIVLPLIITDFQILYDFPIMRVGSIAMLIFVFSLTRPISEKTEHLSFVKNLFVAITYGASLALIFAALSLAPNITKQLTFNAFLTSIQPFIFLGVAISLLITIFDQLRSILDETRSHQFERWLNNVDTKSKNGFLESIFHYQRLHNCRLVNENLLTSYDIDSLISLLKRNSFLSISELEDTFIRETNTKLKFAADQLVYLLRENQSNHLCLVTTQPFTALLVYIPELGNTKQLKIELAVINRIATALNNAETTH